MAAVFCAHLFIPKPAPRCGVIICAGIVTSVRYRRRTGTRHRRRYLGTEDRLPNHWVLYTLLAMWVTWSLLPPSPESYSVWFFIGDVVLQAVVVLLTVLSGVNYVWKNRDLLSDVK
ncbi:MAG: hypothetical protein ACLVL7_11605 [Anaerotruncus massiliensis (ex Togo et al. 2019)]